MGLLSRSKPAKPYLDGLTTLPTLATALREAGLRPTGAASVCVKPVEGGVVSASEAFDMSSDEFGYTWLTRRTARDDIARLTEELHALVVAGDQAGFGPALLCAVVPFSDGRKPTVALIYRFTRGTWYPFAPTGPDERDNARELEIRTRLGKDANLERDLTRWSPVWGAPGL
ncbi:MAG TPA: hypothetical protein VHA79_06735 [Mycobacteriales bacterium]|jgi:hypothetical protein|nr:hypothetical protein [Mycobacteriales bacterium]HVX69373.1 hypothetical protein [Mycobacteriales bacterium]